jgi:hypothetical protein
MRFRVASAPFLVRFRNVQNRAVLPRSSRMFKVV